MCLCLSIYLARVCYMPLQHVYGCAHHNKVRACVRLSLCVSEYTLCAFEEPVVRV